MAARSTRETHKWTPEETRQLIFFRTEKEPKFLKSKYAAKLWETLVKEMGLEGKVTGQQAAKKWENLKQKYKAIGEPSSPASSSAASSSPLPSPSPRKRRKRNPILDFLTEESNKEQRRHEESEAENKATTERFLSLLEKL